MHFIGSLFIQNILSAKIVAFCLKTLLQGSSETSSYPPMRNIEGFCTLMTAVGETLDARADFRGEVDQCILRAKDCAANGGYENRTKFKVKDVLDLRVRGWEKRVQQQDKGPMSKDEIRKAFQRLKQHD